MLVHLYVRRGTVFIPSVGMTESGLYIDLEPVDVVALRDHSAVEAAVARALARAPSRINTPSPFPRPVVLKYAKARSWVEFERDTATWAVDYEDGQFKIIPYRKSSDGGWDEDSENAEGFPVGSEISDVARRMVELIGG